jgi:hypothetical protein
MFKLTVGADDIRFNHTVAVYIMYIEVKPVIHVVCEATHFQAARFFAKYDITGDLETTGFVLDEDFFGTSKLPPYSSRGEFDSRGIREQRFGRGN